MVSNNAKSVIKQVLASGDTVGLLPATDVGGMTRYVADFSAFPAVVEDTFTLTAANAGISVGSGSTAPTDADYQLVAPITSGLTGTVVTTKAVDGNGNASITFAVTLTNTSGSNITVSEIGYKQEISASDTVNGTTATDRVFLLDRSTFNTVTIAPSGQAAIDYTLKVVITNNGGAEGTKNITQNGTYNAIDDSLDGYSQVVVNVSGSATLGTKTITLNGVYNASSDNYDGYSQVTVNVSGGGGSVIPLIMGNNYMFNVAPDDDYMTLYANTGQYYIVAMLVSYSGGGGDPRLTGVTNGTFTQIGTMVGDNTLSSDSCVFTLYLVEKTDATLDSSLSGSDYDIVTWVPLRGNPTIGTMTKNDNVTTGQFTFNAALSTDTTLLVAAHRLQSNISVNAYTIRMLDVNKKHYTCCMGRYNYYIFIEMDCIENDGSNTATVNLYNTNVQRATYCYIPISFS